MATEGNCWTGREVPGEEGQGDRAVNGGKFSRQGLKFPQGVGEINGEDDSTSAGKKAEFEMRDFREAERQFGRGKVSDDGEGRGE